MIYLFFLGALYKRAISRQHCREIAREEVKDLLCSCLNYLMSVVSFISTSLPFLS